MKKQKGFLPATIGAVAMLTLILDSKTAILSARAGAELCLQTVIPSLFPFFVLSGAVSSSLLGREIKVLRPIGRLCRIPKGSETLLLLGFLAGYPVGAQMVADACRQGDLSIKDRNRMLGFCCNAGPAFIFGMLSPLFRDKWVLWVLWAIHICSALAVGILLPGSSNGTVNIPKATSLSLADSLRKGVKTMGLVCGWVVIFRVLLGFINGWILWVLPVPFRVIVSGLLELSNGCVLLWKLPSEGMRFVVADVFLSLGGLCVWMQTNSVTGPAGTGWYLPGKLLQSLLSLSVCLAVYGSASYAIAIGAVTVLTVLLIRKKLGIEKKTEMLYNTTNLSAKETGYVIS